MRDAPPHRQTPFDWTLSPAKWGAVGVLALLGAGGLAWSVIRVERGQRETPARAELREQAGSPEHERRMGDRPITLLGDAGSGLDGRGDGGAGAVGAVEADATPVEPVPSPVVGAPVAGAPSTSPAVNGGGVPASPIVEPEPTIARRIDINTASEAELQLLPGIGPMRARAIIEDRRVNGRFRSVDELDRVEGIGAGIIAGLREFARAG